MPLDPGLSLDVAGGGGQGAPPLPGAGGTNALGGAVGLMGTMSEIGLRQQEIAASQQQQANAAQQMQLLQMQVQGRTKAGQIIASSPDLDTAIASLSKDPGVMGGYPQALSDLRTLQTQQQQLQNLAAQHGEIQARTAEAATGAGLNVQRTTQSRAETGHIGLENVLTQAQTAKTGVETQGLQQQQQGSALDSIVSAAAGAISDPAQLQGLVGARLAAMPPALRAQVAPAAQDFINSVQDPDPVKMQKNLIARAIGAGLDPVKTFAAGGMVPPQITTAIPGPSGQPMARLIGGTQGASATPNALTPGQSPAPWAPGASNQLMPAGAISPPPEALASGPGKVQEGYLAKRGPDMADYQQRLDENVSTGSSVMQNLQQARDAMGAFRSGGGAETYARLASMAQAIGVPQKTVDQIANGNLAASQEFQKLMTNTTMNQIKQQIPAGSRLSQMEFKAFNENNPNISTDPRAIEKIFNFWTSIYSRDVKEQQGLNSYLGRGGDISRWPAEWQAQMQQQGLVTPALTKEGGKAQKDVDFSKYYKTNPASP